MKTLILAVAMSGFVVAVPTTEANAAKCPADPVKAGRQIWPAGSVEFGKAVTKRHPCGKRVRCIGAKGVGEKFKRECKWLD